MSTDTPPDAHVPGRGLPLTDAQRAANEALRVAAHRCIDLSSAGSGFALAVRSPTETARGRLTVVWAIEIPDDGEHDQEAIMRDCASVLDRVLDEHGVGR